MAQNYFPVPYPHNNYFRFVIQNLLCSVWVVKVKVPPRSFRPTMATIAPKRNPVEVAVWHWADTKRGYGRSCLARNKKTQYSYFKVNLVGIMAVFQPPYIMAKSTGRPCQLWWWPIVMCSTLVHSSGGFLPFSRVPWLLRSRISQGLDDDSSEPVVRAGR